MMCGKSKGRLGVWLLIGFLLVAAHAVSAQQTVFRTRSTEEQGRVTIKACILLVGSSLWENPDPMYLNVLNEARFGLKPAGWEFENPLAPKTITPDIDNMWNPTYQGPITFGGITATINNKDDSYFQNPYLAQNHSRPNLLPLYHRPAGTPVSKEMPQYWEVPLTESTASELVNFDIVFLHTHRLMNYTAQELSWIQRFVDAGGTLWLENGHGSRVAIQPAFGDPQVGSSDPNRTLFALLGIPFQYRDSWPPRQDQYGVNPGGFTVFPKFPVDRRHPLLTEPFKLTDEEVNSLGDVGWADHLLVTPNTLNILQEVVRSGFTLNDRSLPGDVIQGNPPAIVAGNYGSGRIIISGVDITDDTSKVIERDMVRPHPQQAADIKFLYNTVKWAADWSQFRGNARHHARALGGGSRSLLDMKWRYPEAGEPPLPPIYSSPVVDRGVIYFTAGDLGTGGFLYALDANPFQDLDGDGTPEDAARDPADRNYPASPPLDPGTLDVSKDKTYDLIWRAPLQGGLSWRNSPAVATVLEPNTGLPIQVVYVATRSDVVGAIGNSRVEAYYATLDPAINRVTRLTPGQRLPWWNAPVLPNTRAISAPVVHVGKLYVVAVTDPTLDPTDSDLAQVLALNLADGSLSSDPNGPFWQYPYPGLAEAPIVFGALAQQAAVDSPSPSLISTPAVATAVDEETGLAFDAVVFGAANGTVYTVSGAANRFRIKTNQPIKDAATVQIRVEWQEGPIQRVLQLQPNVDFLVEDLKAGVIRIQRAVNGIPVGGKTAKVTYEPPSGNPIAHEPHPVPEALQPRFPTLLPQPLPRNNVDAVVASPTVIRDDAVAFGSRPVQRTTTYVANGRFTARSAAAGTHLWSFDPASALPNRSLTGFLSFWGFVASPALALDTIYAAGSQVSIVGVAPSTLLGALYGFHTRPTLAVPLGTPVPPALEGSIRVKLFPQPPVGLNEDQITIHPDFYSVDYNTGVITFVLPESYNVVTVQPAFQLPIDGRAIWVQIGNGPALPYAVPRLTRWQYVPFVVQLNHYPVDQIVSVQRGGSAVNPTDVDPYRGLISFSTRPAVWGETVRVVYDHPGGRSAETHVVPRLLGPITSSPLVTGNLVHVGTGFAGDADGDGAFTIGEQGKLITLFVDTITGQLQASAFPNALPTFQGFNPLSINFDSSPAPGPQGEVFAGAWMAAAGGQRAGVFYALATPQLLITDSDRILEVDGAGNALWQVTGTSEPNPLPEPLDPQPAQGGAQANQLSSILTTPFVRPNKATRLPSGNLLVVDTGNNRVVEIDAGGSLLWPLNKEFIGLGVHRYKGILSLGLREPSDAQRLYLNEWVPVMDDQGRPTGNTQLASVSHTVIADPGNYRILDVRSWVDNNATPRYFQVDLAAGRFAEEPTVLTPEFIYDAAQRRYRRLRYEQVQVWQRTGLNQPQFPLVCVARVADLDQLVLVAPEIDPNDPNDVNRSRIINRHINPNVARWDDGWLYTWFMGRTFPGLRSFEQFRQGNDYFTALIDYEGGSGVVHLFRNRANGTDEVWRFTLADYARLLGPAARTWRPVCVRKLPGQRLLIVNEGSGQALGEGGQVIEVEYDLTQSRPNHVRLLSVVPDPDPDRDYPGSYDAAVPRYAERQ